MPAQLQDHFTLGLPLGRNAAGAVWQAEDKRDESTVAIAMVDLEEVQDKALGRRLSTRFRRDLELLKKVTHPNITRVHEVGRDADGRPFAAMEFVDGENLDDWLATPRSGRDRIEIANGLLEGMEAAHRVGVTHGDLEPGNILVTDDGIPKVIGFGLNRALARQAEPGWDESSGLVRSLSYRAPEQARGSGGTRTDIYALGLILHRVLLERLPHEDRGSAGLPTPIAAVLRKSLAEDAAERHVSVWAMRKAWADAVKESQDAIDSTQGIFETAPSTGSVSDDQPSIVVDDSLSPNSESEEAVADKGPESKDSSTAKADSAKTPALAKTPPRVASTIGKAPPKIIQAPPKITKAVAPKLEAKSSSAPETGDATKSHADSVPPVGAGVAVPDADDEPIVAAGVMVPPATPERGDATLAGLGAPDPHEPDEDLRAIASDSINPRNRPPSLPPPKNSGGPEDSSELSDADLENGRLSDPGMRISLTDVMVEQASSQPKSSPPPHKPAVEPIDVSPPKPSKAIEEPTIPPVALGASPAAIGKSLEEPPKAIPWPMVLVAVVLLAVGYFVWKANGTPPEPVAMAPDTADRTDGPTEPAIDPETTEAPPVLSDAEVRPPILLTLHGLVDGASVTIDGLPATATAERAVLFPNDGRQHVLEVRSPGMLPWQRTLATDTELDLLVRAEVDPNAEADPNAVDPNAEADPNAVDPNAEVAPEDSGETSVADTNPVTMTSSPMVAVTPRTMVTTPMTTTRMTRPSMRALSSMGRPTITTNPGF